MGNREPLEPGTDDTAPVDREDLSDEERRAVADERELALDERDTDADRAAFLTSPHYGDDLPARRHSALDRAHSRDDRTSAAADRSDLAAAAPGDDTDDPEPEADQSSARTTER